jgi:hypothetical protein
MRLIGHVANMRKMTNANGITVRNPEGNRPLQRHRHRWKNNIKRYLKITVT